MRVNFFETLKNSYLWIVVVTLCLALFIDFLIVIFNSFSNARYIKDCNAKSLLNKAMKKSNIWFNMSVLWLTLEYIGILIPFESSCIVLLLNAYNKQSVFTNILYSAISMIFVVLVYAINPHKHVKGYRTAYQKIDDAINRQMISNDNELCKALAEAEKDINMAFDIDDEE